MNIRNSYISELDGDTLLKLKKSSYASRLPLCCLPVSSSSISPDETEWLHCVDANRNGNVVYIRVITNTKRGVNVCVPLITKEMLLKYYDLRFQIRNSDCVMITFPKLFVKASTHRNNELYLLAYDFKQFNDSK